MIEAVIFDVYGTLLQIGERRRPFRNLLKQARSQGRQPRADDARTLMTQNVGLAGAANLFGTQLGNVELATLELDLYAELASVRPYDDALRALESLKRAGLKVALCSNLATPYAIPAMLLLPEFDAYAWSFEVGAIKPEPAIYDHLVKRLDCKASSIAMIGDTLEADVLGPERLGVHGFHLRRDAIRGPDRFASLIEFADQILGMGTVTRT
ncbi:HAD family hydrolase [Stutzerimonas stutzeri]|uniref:HAD family hydrolase n=1 Tax=Stutzerimonas stutzeri TaxID=316 RepID=UPI001BAF79B7|nr:HAD family hydrolase [Stutzerimonas stutzeri]QUE75282.1 HAD family hydrolase [Stutzerimonas stutzeri]